MKVPKAFRYSGSRVKPVEGTLEVMLPDDFEDLPEHEKQLVREEQFDAIVHKRYLAVTEFNPAMHTLLTHPDFSTVMEPFTSALNSWEESLEDLQYHLVILCANWDNLADVESPLHYTDESGSQILRNFRWFAVYQRSIALLCQKLGCDGSGCVRDKDYEAIRAIIARLRSKWDAEECGGPYPFEIEEEQKEI